MSEKHEMSFDEFDLRVDVADEGDVWISFHESGKCVFTCSLEAFRECLDFAKFHGLKMTQTPVPMF